MTSLSKSQLERIEQMCDTLTPFQMAKRLVLIEDMFNSQHGDENDETNSSRYTLETDRRTQSDKDSV